MLSFVKWWNRNTNFRPLLQSRLILYVLFFFSVVTLLGYGMSGDFLFAVIFLIVGFLTSFFSKNMIVILFLALAVTQIIRQGAQPRVSSSDSLLEGMDTQTDDSSESRKEPMNTLNPEELEEDSKKEGKKTTLTASGTEMKKKPEESAGIDMKNKLMTESKAKKEIKNLLDLQLKLMSGINSMQPILKEVEANITKMRRESFQ